MWDSNFNPFNDDILSIMTQRDYHEEPSAIEMFWNKQETLAIAESQAVAISDDEEEAEVTEIYSLEQLERTFNGAPDMFLTNYHNTVNESVEAYVLDAQLYDTMTADCSSALYECLVNG